ncbi:MAG: hypothetical protein K2Y29_10300, partial [Beijerinckiaceae bacterium]|nr:hypothetical protein [Beijerinckiaceae bacterium]
MATVVLQTIGAAVGQFLGGPIGAAIGQTVGAVAGSAIDQRLFGPRGANGPRLSSMPALASTEGAPVPVVFGRARVGGQVIWATRFEENGQGQSAGKALGAPKQKTYMYFANFAVGLCEGPIAGVRRIWADGKEIDQTRFNIRVYRGGEDQHADALIVAKEGAANAPAYRGLAYAVFERMPLADFGNRIPQLSFEIARPMNALAQLVRGVDIIPGAGEFAYGQKRVLARGGAGGGNINRNTLVAKNDWAASLDALEQSCPNATSAALVVSWFGDDLRAGQCTIAPRVDDAAKRTSGAAWSVAGLSRASARVASQADGRAAYGGTPSDASVIEAIDDLRARGLSVVFYPFVMMDIAAGNALPDPWTGASGQPAYPWRG